MLREENYLGKEMDLRGLVVTLPASPCGDYWVEGAEIYRGLEPADLAGMDLLYLRTRMEKGLPGRSTSAPGVPGIRLITVTANGVRSSVSGSSH